jgi:phosphomannomutase/phosphoglucomutase
MVRLFSWLAAITLLMFLISGAGVYWMSHIAISNSKEESATAIAKAVAATLSAQIDLLNKTIDKIVDDPEILAVITNANPVQLSTTAAKLEKYFPEVLKIRLFVPGVSPTDDQVIPKMSFADIEMVRETFTKSRLPSIQGDQGADRHLAITRPIKRNNEVIGVILVSLNYDFISKNIRTAAAKDEYIELKQDLLALGVSGVKINTDKAASVSIKVPSATEWEIIYYYVDGMELTDMSVSATIVLVSGLITLLAFFSIHRQLSSLLTQDVNCVMKAIKDMMTTQKLYSTYPVNLAEMDGVIPTLAQFKRVLDQDNNNDDTIPDNYDDVHLDNFFDD